MFDKRTVALVIATYKSPRSLRLVLESVLHQSVLPNEISIADDGSGKSTQMVIDEFRKRFSVPVRHFWHPDDGFRKTIIMNKAIAGTHCDYIIQIDGDIVLHPHFVRDHLDVAEYGCYIRGSRVLLSENKSKDWIAQAKSETIFPFSQGIKNRINAIRVPALSPLFIKKSFRSDNVIGCNLAFWKSDFVKVNGYNNDLKGWGHEDIELAARFVYAGVMQKKVKMMAVCYHLYHPHNERDRETVNYRIYEDTLRKGRTYCSNGYHKVQRYQH